MTNFEAAFAQFQRTEARSNDRHGHERAVLRAARARHRRGRLVITTRTFIATVRPIAQSGATPVFVDIDHGDDITSTRR
ncbi:MAG: DegT/DnrJ/EryC1/StrS family aminotransferase [Chloroflexi bacterium]|uniref:DegT/DnrJ/EryC1/StrS family aminotransferase n=1 Tax=Candidatus Flexifilum breve TaxID=3140694 RepID=UPI003136B1F8|nr:DegT/DnrJ/EryC1/StrS family aminotransferase [Chloroflexota bacterium]